jgi:hypothetical protein
MLIAGLSKLRSVKHSSERFGLLESWRKWRQLPAAKTKKVYHNYKLDESKYT